MLLNLLGGLQGIADQIMVGQFVGHVGNAAIGISFQILLVVIVFISSVYTGMAVLVARFTGASEPDKVNRCVYQAFLLSVLLAIGVMAPLGYIFAPHLLDIVNPSPDVRAEALPYLRIMFVFSIGLLMFFMCAGALRAAGDARTPLYLGIALTVLNIILNGILIPGLGPIPAFGTRGAAMATVMADGIVSTVFVWLFFSRRLVIQFSNLMDWRPDLPVIRELFRFGLPAGFQGVVMNIAGVLLLRFIGSLEYSAETQAVYAVAYSELFSLITWTSVGLMGATAAIAGQNLGAGCPERSIRAAQVASCIGLVVACIIGVFFLSIPEYLFAIFGMTDGLIVGIGRQLLGYLAFSGLFVTVALTYTGALQGTGDTRSPLYISLVSQIMVPLGICVVIQASRTLQPNDIWMAILSGHISRAVFSFFRFRQEKWRNITVDIGLTHT